MCSHGHLCLQNLHNKMFLQSISCKEPLHYKSQREANSPAAARQRLQNQSTEPRTEEPKPQSTFLSMSSPRRMACLAGDHSAAQAPDPPSLGPTVPRADVCVHVPLGAPGGPQSSSQPQRGCQGQSDPTVVRRRLSKYFPREERFPRFSISALSETSAVAALITAVTERRGRSRKETAGLQGAKSATQSTVSARSLGDSPKVA